jgi:hypothetical protein
MSLSVRRLWIRSDTYIAFGVSESVQVGLAPTEASQIAV